MKILKRIGIAILAIFLLIVIIGLFLPSVTHVEKSTVINAPVETVFEQVNVLKNWEKWSPWYKMDTSKLSYSGPPSGNGASYSWVGKKTGEGILTLSDVKQNEHITENMVFGGSNKATATMDFTKEGAATKVVWKMDLDNGWNVFGRIFSEFFMKGMLAEQFEDGLTYMKDVAEHAPVVSSTGVEYKVQEIDLQPGFAVAIAGKETEDTFGAFFAKSFPAIAAAIVKGGGKPMGAPFAIIYEYIPQGITTLDAAMPVDKKIAVPANMKVIDTKGGKAVKVDYYGDYNGTGAAHEAIDKWLKANNKKATGAPWEVYANDPMVEKDTAKWHTEVIYPIQ